MSTYIVFDRQQHRWMKPLQGSEASQILNKDHEKEYSYQCCSCLIVSAVSCLLWNLAKTGTCGCLGWTTLFYCCVDGTKIDEANRIQEYIKKNGWLQFEETIPLEGQRCVIIDNPQHSL